MLKVAPILTIYSAFAWTSMINRIRPALRYVLASFSGLSALIPSDGALLDVGCGDGILAVYLRQIKKRTQRIVGVDIDERKIHIASQLDLPEVEFHHKGVADIRSQTFDIVTVVHVLYLIPMALREQFVTHCVRVLKPGGTLVLMLNIDTPRWNTTSRMRKSCSWSNCLGSPRARRYSSSRSISASPGWKPRARWSVQPNG